MSQTNGNSRKPLPHHRLTLKDVVRDYQSGLVTVKGAIFYAIASSRKLGGVVKIYPTKLAKQLGIGKSALYKRIAELKLEGRIDFEIEGALLVKVPIEEKTGIPSYIFLSELSTFVDKNSTNVDKKAPKSAPTADSEAPLSIQSLLSLSVSTGERDLKSDLEDDREFHKWLINKANLLPKKPALTNQWVSKQAQKPENQEEYLQHLNTLQRVSLPENLSLEEITNQAEYWKRVHERRDES